MSHMIAHVSAIFRISDTIKSFRSISEALQKIFRVSPYALSDKIVFDFYPKETIKVPGL